ncbi:MAG: hypothetical protein Q8P71_01240 [bacterium]|nr:hypothetical protein [bacterium]
MLYEEDILTSTFADSEEEFDDADSLGEELNDDEEDPADDGEEE